MAIVDYNLRIKGAKELAKLFEKAGEVSQYEFDRALVLAATRVKNTVIKETPIGATRKLRRSIDFEIARRRSGTVSIVIYSDLYYAPYVTFGIPPTIPPIAPLLDWVEKKLHLEGREALEAAYGTQKKIRTVGIESNPFIERAAKKAAPRAEAFFQVSLDNVAKYLRKSGL